ncbi:MAG: D-aminoacyl-tRNA deacylase [Acidimicrobiia bacterium]
MRAVVQRVSRASVSVSGTIVSEIGHGLLVLVGVTEGDSKQDADALAAKIAGLRVFGDVEGKMNLALDDVGGAVLVVSQFTLYGSVRKGRRPSFTGAAHPDVARPIVERVIARLREADLDVGSGRFGELMAVELVNDGPLTFVIDVRDGSVR